ncbi:MAG: hypothetical protein GX102_04865 [Porphyromonadaceae bacterium]|jgi:predicted metal-binding protein|nr:hypothetical protein [Porphyromonadaceae bacterium]
MKFICYTFLVFALFSCKGKVTDSSDSLPVLEVAGRFLYQDELEKIIPPNVSVIDSADVADRYIRKWVTEVLMYENARRNITNISEINKLVEEYRRSLIIHEYEQALIAQRLEREITEAELIDFYNKFKSQLLLNDNIVKGILLILPKDAPQLNDVYSWVRSADTKSLENIEKYSLKNAISYDYFNEWTAFSDIVRKTPFVIEDSRNFVTNTNFAETADSTKLYLLQISDALLAGEVEPYEMAKERIKNTILNKKKTDFIVELEKSIFNDAQRNGEINYFKNR